MKRTLTSAIAIGALTIALSGCFGGSGGDDETTPAETTAQATTEATAAPATESAAPTTDDGGDAADSAACDLLTTDEISTILGIDFSAAEVTAESDTCDWTLTDDNGVITVLITSYTDDSGTWDMQAAMYKGFDENAAEITVDGADHALRYSLMGTSNVVLGKGSLYAQVTYMAFATNAPGDDAVLQLADAVVDHM